MTDVLPEVDAPSDAELISRVRGGDVAAYGDLFARHQAAANRLARQLIRGSDADDLVSEAFAKVLTVLQGGGGPDVAFRAYLLTAVRRLHVDRVRSGQRLQTTDDMTPFDPGVPFQDTAVAGFENGAAAKAFASLPERWQLVLWHLEVEGQKPADVAPLLGMSANSVSALAYRAREGLRQAFLTMHLSDLSETDCRWVTEHLGAYVRKGLSKRDSAKVQEHLDGCRRCTAMYLELTEVNSNLAGIIAPLLLGAAAAGYLSSGGAGAAGVLGLVSKAKELVGANTGAVAATGVGAAVVAAAVAAITLSGNHGHKPDVVADAPAAASTVAAPSPALPDSSRPGSQRSSSSAAASTAGTTAAVPSVTASPASVAPPGVTALADVTTTDGTLPTDGTTDVPASGTTDNPTDGPTGPTGGPSGGTTGFPLTIADTTINDDGVDLVAAADPMPDVLTVDLVSQPTGVVFDQNQPSGCTASAGGTQVQCLTGTGSTGARVPGTAAAANPTHFTASLPFDQSVGSDADVSVTVNGVTESGVSHHFTRDVDVALAFDGPVSRPVGNAYDVDGSLTITGARAGSVRDVVYTVTGGVFGNGDAAVTRPATQSSPSFTVKPDDAAHPDVRISAAPVPALHDTNVDNDGGATALKLRPYDVAVTQLVTDAATPVANRSKQQSFTGTVNFDGFPTPGDVTVTPSVPEGDEVTAFERNGGTVTFTITGTQPGDVGLRAALPNGYTDATPANDTATATFTPHAFALDVALSGFPPDLLHPGKGDVYTVTGHVAVTGPAADELGTITYRVSGGTFTSPSGVENGRTMTFPADTDAPTFYVVPDDLAHPGQVTFSVDRSELGDYVDTEIGNDTATVSMARYDVSLGELTAVDPVANRAKQQSFTATVDDDGFPGRLTFTVTKPSGDSAGEVTLDDNGRLLFTVTGGVDGPVTLAASLPTGWTDAFDGDNTASATFVPHAFGLDVALSKFPVTVHPGPNDVYSVPGHVAETGVASGELENVTYQVTGARFVGADKDTDGRKLTLPVTEHDPLFSLVPDDPANPGAVTISLDRSALGDFVDTDETNDAATVTLARYDVGLGALTAKTPAASRDGQQTFTVAVDDDGVPGPLTFTVTRPTGDEAGHVDYADGVATFTVTGTHAGDVGLTAHLPEGYTDASDADNTATATFVPHDFRLDVALSGFPTDVVHPGRNDVYSVPGLVAVTGPAATELDTITYTLSGGTFIDPLLGDVGRTLTLPATNTTPTFSLKPDNAAKPDAIAITATVGDEFTDTAAGNDSASLTLARYDVRVASLAPTGPTGSDHTQSFRAELVTDGFPSSDLALTTDVPPGDTAGAVSRRDDGTVTFTVSGSNPGPVSLTASLPTGWTDADTSDNTASATFTLPLADAGVKASQRDTGDSGKSTLTAALTATPDVPLQLDVTFDTGQVQVEQVKSAACTVVSTGLRCSYGGATSPAFAVTLVDREGHETRQATIGFSVTAPGYQDNDPDNDRDSVTVVRH